MWLSWTVKSPVVEKHLSRTIEVILNGVHQAVSEIDNNFHGVLSRLNGNAVDLCSGHRERRTLRTAEERTGACTRSESPATELHGARDVSRDWSSEVVPNRLVNFGIVSETN